MDLITKVTQGSFEIENYEDLKKDLISTLQKYKGLVVKEEDISEAKSIRARLNTVSKTFNSRRIELEKEYMLNFNVGKNQVKELVDLTNEVSSNIDIQLKAFDKKLEDEKKEEIIKMWTEFNFTSISLEQIFNPSWLNKGYKMKDIEKELIGSMEQVIDDLQIIDKMTPNDLMRRKSIKQEYFNVLNINKAITLIDDKNAKMSQLNASSSVLDTKKELFEVNLTLIGTKAALKSLKIVMKELNIKYEENMEELK